MRILGLESMNIHADASTTPTTVLRLCRDRLTADIELATRKMGR